jgi:tRNA(Ile)-lysidine synthase
VEDISPQAKKSMAKSMAFLQEDALILRQLMDAKKQSLFERKGQNITISIRNLMKHKPLDVWLFYLLKDFDFHRKVTNNLAFVLQNEMPGGCGKTFHSETHALLIARDELIVQQIKPKDPQTDFPIQESQQEVKIPVHLHLSLEVNDSHFVFENNPSLAYFDAEQLRFPLTIRKWKQGDRFVPFGMTGSKLVSDFFIDNKVDRFSKENTWLLLSGEEIIWIIGQRASNIFRVEKSSKTILKISLEKV